jgi:CHAT domain-containing protein/Tfp pilus assembly protein PilF
MSGELETQARRAETLAHRIEELYEVGRYSEGILLAEALVANQIQLFGPDHEETAESLNLLGLLLRLAGRPREAILHHERALAILTRRLGTRTLETARTHELLGSARLVAGELAGAEPDLVAALEIFRSIRGPKNLETAHSLNSMGYLRRLQGRLAEARQLLEQSLAIHREEKGDNDSDTLAVLRNLAALTVEQGDLQEARKGFERALAISLRVLGREHPDTARVQGELAEVLLDLWDLPRAQEAYRHALTTTEKVLGSQHPDRARYLGGLGSVAKAQGDYSRAKEYFAAALALYETVRGTEHPDTATAASNLGTALEAIGQLEEAIACYERALVIDRKVYGEQSLQTAKTLDNLGVARMRFGQMTEARCLLEEALAIRKEKLGPRHPVIARSLTNLGGLYHVLGDLATAQAFYEEALAIRTKSLGPTHPSTAASWNNLASLCEDRGDLTCARERYERALTIWEAAVGKDHPNTAVALNNLGMVVAALGDPQRALQLLTRAQAIWERVYGADHPVMATVLENLGSLFRFVGDPESEKLYLEKALDLRFRTLGGRHPEVARSHHNLGVLLRQLGRLVESRDHLKRAAALREELLGGDHPETAASLAELSATEMAAGNVDCSLDLAERASAIDERWVRAVLKLGSDAEKRLFLRTVAGGADWAVTAHLRDNPANARAARLALTAVLRTKGRALDATVAGRERLRRQLGPEEQTLLTKRAELVQEQAALLLRPQAGTLPAQTQRRLRTLTEDIRQIEAELARKSAAIGGEAPAIELETVQKQIRADTALIEFFIFQPWDAKARGNPWQPPRYAAYVLRSTGAPAAVDLGDAALLDRAVGSFRQALAEPWNDAKVQGRALNVLTLEKLRPLLGNAESLLIAPDGELNLIPFAALVDKGGRYLLESLRISYLTSGRELLSSSEETCDSREPPLVIGGPDFEGMAGKAKATPQESGNDPFPPIVSPLPEAAAEATAIGSFLNLTSARILTGGRAREVAVKSVRGPRLLHLATHGFFLPNLASEETLTGGDRLFERARESRVEVFLRSALALAGYNRRHQTLGADDGVLTALEVMDLDLCGTELVTLSACETGVGEARSGQGVFGLRRALAIAGARSQMLTLWQVQDQTTKEIMVSFYAQVRQGVPFAEALRRTQLAVLRQESLPATNAHLRGIRPLGRPAPGSTAALAHPYYWASFILSGNAEHTLEPIIDVTNDDVSQARGPCR